MLEGIKDVHRAMLHSVLVAGNEASSHAPVIGILSRSIQIRRSGVESLDSFGTNRRFLSEPDGRAYDKDIGQFGLLINHWPIVLLPPVSFHVRPDTVGDIVVHGPQRLDRDAILLHDRP